MNIEPSPAWNNAVQGIQNAQNRAVKAASRIGSEGVAASPDADIELMLSRVELKANAKVVRTLDQMVGGLLDTLA